MSAFASFIKASNPGSPSYAPYFLIFNFLSAYVFLSSRPLKNYLGIDHNVNPREDVTKYGEAAVAKGRITRRQLNLLKRNEAAHANAVEHLPVFAAALLFAQQAGVSNEIINATGLIYTLIRLAYAVAYLAIEDARLSFIRSLLWWAGNVSCLYLLFKSAPAIQ